MIGLPRNRIAATIEAAISRAPSCFGAGFFRHAGFGLKSEINSIAQSAAKKITTLLAPNHA